MDKKTQQNLIELEHRFLQSYPGGFHNPDIAERAKKHNVPKIAQLAEESLSIEQFGNLNQIIETVTKIITGSSMISLFEKPRFRDAMRGLSGDKRHIFVDGMKELLHGNNQAGFNSVLEILSEQKMAKWTLMSAIPFYYQPSKNWFIKPTTTKNILRYFEVEDIKYKPRPSYDFYTRYSDFLNELKKQAPSDLSKSNAQFTGFLMMAIS